MALNHEHFMDICLELALKAGAEGNRPLGSLIVDDAGTILSQGTNRVYTDSDPTAHGEMVVIRDLSAKRRTQDLSGLTLYTSMEPCPMCCWAILETKFDRTRARRAPCGPRAKGHRPLFGGDDARPHRPVDRARHRRAREGVPGCSARVDRGAREAGLGAALDRHPGACRDPDATSGFRFLVSGLRRKDESGSRRPNKPPRPGTAIRSYSWDRPGPSSGAPPPTALPGRRLSRLRRWRSGPSSSLSGRRSYRRHPSAA